MLFVGSRSVACLLADRPGVSPYAARNDSLAVGRPAVSHHWWQVSHPFGPAPFSSANREGGKRSGIGKERDCGVRRGYGIEGNGNWRGEEDVTWQGLPKPTFDVISGEASINATKFLLRTFYFSFTQVQRNSAGNYQRSIHFFFSFTPFPLTPFFSFTHSVPSDRCWCCEEP